MRTAQAGFKSGKDGKTPADLLAELGPTFRVDIGLKSRSPAGPKPDLAKKGVRALIDTGAGGNCIDAGLARSLGLPIINEGEVSGVGGKTFVNIYMARIYIPDLERLLFEPFAGVKLEEGEQWHRVILGRTFLRPYRLIYDAISGRVEVEEK
jgi:hypothetical protein